MTELRTPLLKTLDNPVRLLFWSYDEFLLMVTPFFAGMFLDSLLCMFCGIILRPLYLKVKRKFPHGSLKHKFYWILPKSGVLLGKGASRLPPSCYRRLLL